jgi:putative ABC transport system substrate-binding protein
VTTLAHPGRNVTGLSNVEPGIVGKWLGMLKEIAPNVSRAALIGNPKTTAFEYFQKAAMAASPALEIEIVPSVVANSREIENAIASMASADRGSLIFPPDATTFLSRDLIVELAERYRLPAVYASRAFVEAGGLMSYSTDFGWQYRLAASYVDRILRGTKPGDIPVQGPTKFQTVVNLKAAKAIGLTVPSGLLVAADEVIE